MRCGGAVIPASAQTDERSLDSGQIAGSTASPSIRDLEAFADGAIASSMQDLDPTAALLSVKNQQEPEQEEPAGRTRTRKNQDSHNSKQEPASKNQDIHNSDESYEF